MVSPELALAIAARSVPAPLSALLVTTSVAPGAGRAQRAASVKSGSHVNRPGFVRRRVPEWICMLCGTQHYHKYVSRGVWPVPLPPNKVQSSDGYFTAEFLPFSPGGGCPASIVDGFCHCPPRCAQRTRRKQRIVLVAGETPVSSGRQLDLSECRERVPGVAARTGPACRVHARFPG